MKRTRGTKTLADHDRGMADGNGDPRTKAELLDEIDQLQTGKLRPTRHVGCDPRHSGTRQWKEKRTLLTSNRERCVRGCGIVRAGVKIHFYGNRPFLVNLAGIAENLV